MRDNLFVFPMPRLPDAQMSRSSIRVYQRSSAVSFCSSDHGDHFFPGCIGSVTMLTFVIPADFTALITVAKAPKATFSSART
jgi:hypothetical protein